MLCVLMLLKKYQKANPEFESCRIPTVQNFSQVLSLLSLPPATAKSSRAKLDLKN